MNNTQSQAIVVRFFSTLDRLIEDGLIRGFQTFTRRYEINRWNMMTLKANPASDIFQVCWLEHLVKDYHVNSHYLLTGEGSFYQDGWNKELVLANLPIMDARYRAKHPDDE